MGAIGARGVTVSLIIGLAPSCGRVTRDDAGEDAPRSPVKHACSVAESPRFAAEGCEEGQTESYVCGDRTLVPWCLCVDGAWDCLLTPELACPADCGDRTAPPEDVAPPACDHLLVVIDGAWACVHPRTCQDWQLGSCRGDGDCEVYEACSPCSGASHCVAGCSPHRCPTEPCSDAGVRPECGDALAVVRDGRWLCVDPTTCDPGECTAEGGDCQRAACAPGTEELVGAPGCAGDERCCVTAHEVHGVAPLSPPAHDGRRGGAFADARAVFEIRRDWRRCTASASCCRGLGSTFDRQRCLLDGARTIHDHLTRAFSRDYVRLDEIAAERCLAGLADAGCDRAEPVDCWTALVGILPDGAEALELLECARPLGIWVDVAEGRCRAPGPLAAGDPCSGSCTASFDATGTHRTECLGGSADLEPCYLSDGLQCRMGFEGSSECAPVAGEGEPCGDFELAISPCAEGLSCREGSCLPLTPAGGGCTGSEDCEVDAYCDGTATCRPRLLAGAACDPDAGAHCLTACRAGRCESALVPCGW